MHVQVRPTLTRTKSDPNDPQNPDDPHGCNTASAGQPPISVAIIMY